MTEISSTLINIIVTVVVDRPAYSNNQVDNSNKEKKHADDNKEKEDDMPPLNSICIYIYILLSMNECVCFWVRMGERRLMKYQNVNGADTQIIGYVL